MIGKLKHLDLILYHKTAKLSSNVVCQENMFELPYVFLKFFFFLIQSWNFPLTFLNHEVMLHLTLNANMFHPFSGKMLLMFKVCDSSPKCKLGSCTGDPMPIRYWDNRWQSAGDATWFSTDSKIKYTLMVWSF